MGKRKANNQGDERSQKRIKSPKVKDEFRPGKYSDMMPSNVTFKVIDGIRYLAPYWSAFGCYTKGRWFGRKVSEVFASEFLANNKHYPKAAIRMGRLFINEKQITDPNYRLKGGDRLIHLGHRHEHPILAEPQIKILADTDKWFVINKPTSMPVHGCGQYRFHSVVGLLKIMYKISGLKVCHRLDRTTSGVLIFAKDHNTDIEFKKLMEGNKLKKEYICKVEGIFPSGEVECKEPIGVLSHKMGIQCIKSDGKHAFSRFTRLYACEAENTSIVSCHIETGRTHQIRVHLQYLGYPIIGDKFYNDLVWGPEKGKLARYGRSFDELQAAVHERHKASIWHETEDPEYEKHLEKIANDPLQQPDKIDLKNLCLDELPPTDSICLGCNVTKKTPDTNYFGLKLHCWRYTSDEWEFEAPLPEWAQYHGDDQSKQPEEYHISSRSLAMSK